VGRPGIKIALMAALTESTLRMLSNTGAYPESANYPNDGNGSDHDSLGLFQMRPQSGWGTVAELMDPTRTRRGRSSAARPARTTPRRAACSTSPAGSRWTPAKPPKPSRSPPTPTGTATTHPSPTASSPPSPQAAAAWAGAGGPGGLVVAGGVPAARGHLGADLAVRDAVHPITGERSCTPAPTSPPPTAPRSSPPPTAPSPSRSSPAATAASSSSSTPSTARPSRPRTRTCGSTASTSARRPR
jgi:hypothetical protein